MRTVPRAKVAYFDICTHDKMTFSEIYAMLVQLSLQKGSFDLWLSLPEVKLWLLLPKVKLSSDSLLSIKTNNDFNMMVNIPVARNQ